ncbi:PREDICTED: uncharacterized protein LOC105549402 [Mandrillus leucophaeus]|uniref:uncharacterized protein LOC105549402 n=1 Tax=Mandrillus leucophaeus TaxID=9568 RepID=UPI0005F3E62F|nr:PREDICTED: uncharacterized protein LOC105549402 [Mandrillus leucophaeus]
MERGIQRVQCRRLPGKGDFSTGGAHEVTEDQWGARSGAWGGAWPWRRARIGALRISLLPYKAVRGELFLEGYIRGLRRPPGGRGARAQGTGRVAATLAPAPGTPGRMGSGWSPASDPRLGAWRSPVRPEPAPLRGVARRRGGAEAGGREVKVRIAGSGRLLEGARRRGPRESRRGRGAGKEDTGHLASAWARGKGDPRVAVAGRSSRTQKQAEKASRARSRTPHRLAGCREAPEEEVPHNGREQRGAERDCGLRPPPACAQSPPRPAGAAAAALPRHLLTPSWRPGLESGG